MTTETEPKNGDSKEHREIHDSHDQGRRPEGPGAVPVERRIEGADHQEGDSCDALDADTESADVRERPALLCPAVPCPGYAGVAHAAASADAKPAGSTNDLIVDMNLLDIRIRIEHILQDEAKHHWQALPLRIRNEYAELYETGQSTFAIARQFCTDSGFSLYFCHDIYGERNQLC